MLHTLDELRELVDARTDTNGAPILGYRKNVEALRVEIQRRENQMAMAVDQTVPIGTPAKSGPLDTPPEAA